MSSKSNDQGRAFEYACITKLKDRIEDKRPAVIDEVSSMAARRAWETQSKSEQQMYLRAADAFIVQQNHLYWSVTGMMMLSFSLSTRILMLRVEMSVTSLLKESPFVGTLVFL